MTLESSEFIRRFLQHVLPQGFHKVRYYGILSPRHRPLLDQIRRKLTGKADNSEDESLPANDDSRIEIPESTMLCPSCHKGRMIPIMTLPPKWRVPP